MAIEETEITVEIVCTELPAAKHSSLHLGIQRDNVIIEAASIHAKRIVFRPRLRVRRNPDGSVVFSGPFVQGPKAERFIYLNWVTTDTTAPAPMVGRIKLHLNHIKWPAVQKAGEGNKPIRVTLTLTNAKGNPVMASVRADVAQWD